MSSQCEEQTAAEKYVVQNKPQRKLSAVTTHFKINFKARRNTCEYIPIVFLGNEAYVYLLYLHGIIIFVAGAI